MQKRNSIRVNSSMFLNSFHQIVAFLEMFRKSENAFRWAINIVIDCSQMSVSEIRFKADATTYVMLSTLKL